MAKSGDMLRVGSDLTLALAQRALDLRWARQVADKSVAPASASPSPSPPAVTTRPDPVPVHRDPVITTPQPGPRARGGSKKS